MLIKKWVQQACPCRLCKNYIPGVGFVESLPKKCFVFNYWFSNIFTPMVQFVFAVFMF